MRIWTQMTCILNQILCPHVKKIQVPLQMPNLIEKKETDHFQPTLIYIVNLLSFVDQATSATNQDSSTVHLISNLISYKNFTQSHKELLVEISTNVEPNNFNQVVQDENWREVMKKEI